MARPPGAASGDRSPIILPARGWRVDCHRPSAIRLVRARSGQPLRPGNAGGAARCGCWRPRIDQAVVVGHSFGGGSATELALRHPGELQGLVLVDAALGELDARPRGRSRQGACASARSRSSSTSASDDQSRRARAVAAVDDCAQGAGAAWLPILREPMRRERHDFGLCGLAAEPVHRARWRRSAAAARTCGRSRCRLR